MSFATVVSASKSVFLIVGVLMLPVQSAWGWSWSDIWQTPHQQQRALEAAGEYESLIESESEQWRGVGQYRSGNYAAAAESFSHTASKEDLNAIYNTATALTRAGDYDAAIEQFDQLLSEQPEHKNAAHNREIAQQLKQLQQQSQQQNQDPNQQGENSDEQQKSGQQGNQQQEQQQGQQQQSQQQDQQSDSEQARSEQNESSQQQNAGEQQEDKAESEQQHSSDESEQAADQQQKQASAMQAGESLTENQQAIEQWLRKIPDDPSGLLRRKLMRSHATDYPGVKDSQSPW